MHERQMTVLPVPGAFAMSTLNPFLAMNSTSSRSTSRTTRIFIFARKCSERSLTLSRRIDFCTSSTLQPLACTFLQMSRM